MMSTSSFPKGDVARASGPEPDGVGWRSPLRGHRPWKPAFLLACSASLLLLGFSFAQDWRIYSTDSPDLTLKIWLLDVDVERSAFTWLSVVALFSAAVLSYEAAAGARARRDLMRWHWFALSGLFLLVSFDEFAGIHEKLSAALAQRMDNTGLLYFAWAAPAGMLALAGLAAFVPFIRSFPTRLASLMVLSAALYLGGAVGLEMVGGSVAETKGINSLDYRLLVNLEEGFELAGTLVFIFVLLNWREKQQNRQPKE
jgi:hypothetical protein